MRFSLTHHIVIAAAPERCYDYIAAPLSWPEWHPASHAIDAPARALEAGEEFQERWHTRRGEVILNWRVTASTRPGFWAIAAETSFIGRICGEYHFDAVTGGTRYTRTIFNPDRARPPTLEQMAAIDDEARLCLANTRRCLEQKRA